ncbi:hypothetical protein BB559_006699 [Furculomyces boomerangus]|uniref:CSC1/OSCA1-like 7TM region domain-containing protein n=2 Tax=Furculomyces boomerangus TaxID=61424 RepID=A0A2T9Y122_9FUNG|nr:hypothetical protein BB559_006699 [Furculomyces boomerangus]
MSTTSISSNNGVIINTEAEISFDAFGNTLLIYASVAVIFILAFCVARIKVKRVYSPRTYAINERKKVPVLKNGLFSWVLPTLNITEDDILKKTNLDSYMILRTVKFLMMYFFIASVFSCAIILPINMISGSKIAKNSSLSLGQKDISILSLKNIETANPIMWVHFIFYIASVVVVLAILVKEITKFIKLRQKELLNSKFYEKEKAYTIMLSGVKDSLLDESKIYDIFSTLPGKVEKVTINIDATELEAIVKERDEIVNKLESILTEYTVKCRKVYDKQKKAEMKLQPSLNVITTLEPPPLPTHRIRTSKSIKSYLNAQEIDSIDFYSNKLVELNKKITEFKNTKISTLKKKSSVFITFSEQISAHLAAQSLVYHDILSIGYKVSDTDHRDVIWTNLNMSSFFKRLRLWISGIAIATIAILWIPICFGIISLVNIKQVRAVLELDSGRFKILDKISASIAPLLINILLILIPFIIKFLVGIEGKPRKSDVKFEVCRRYFLFLIYAAFIVPQFSSIFFQLADYFMATDKTKNFNSLLADVNSIATSSSSYFVSFVLLKMFIGTSSLILMGPPLFIRSIKPFFFATSPRKRYLAEQPVGYDWQTLIPQHFLVFLVGFSYSAISPVINVFCFFYFMLSYYIYHYQFMYIYDDTKFNLGGSSFKSVIQQTFTCLYYAESIWLIMMVVNLSVTPGSIIRTASAVIVIFITNHFDKRISRDSRQYLDFLPLSLANVDSDFENDPKYNFDLNSKSPKGITSGFKNIFSKKTGSKSKSESKLFPKSPAIYSEFDFGDSDSSIQTESLKYRENRSGKSKDPTKYSGLDCIDEKMNIKDSDNEIKSRIDPNNYEDRFDIDYENDFKDSKNKTSNYLINQNMGSFKHPALLAEGYSFLWIPQDDTGLCDDVIAKLNVIGLDYFSIVTKGAYIDKRRKVAIDFDFNFDEHETFANNRTPQMK